MFSAGDIICGILTVGFFAYILIDSHMFEKKMKQSRKETDDERIKQGKKPVDWGASVGYSGSSSDSDAADKFRSDIFRNMGNMG
jgi:hypothetical protein